MNVLLKLSKKHRQITELILKGYTVPEIAVEIGLSAQSVKTYKKQIYKELDVHSKKELFERVSGAGA